MQTQQNIAKSVKKKFFMLKLNACYLIKESMYIKIVSNALIHQFAVI